MSSTAAKKQAVPARALRRASWLEFIKAQRQGAVKQGGSAKGLRAGNIPFNQTERNGRWVAWNTHDNRETRRQAAWEKTSNMRKLVVLYDQEREILRQSPAGRDERQALRFVQYQFRETAKIVNAAY